MGASTFPETHDTVRSPRHQIVYLRRRLPFLITSWLYRPGRFSASILQFNPDIKCHHSEKLPVMVHMYRPDLPWLLFKTRNSPSSSSLRSISPLLAVARFRSRSSAIASDRALRAIRTTASMGFETGVQKAACTASANVALFMEHA
jgi:hypothetical protein